MEELCQRWFIEGARRYSYHPYLTKDENNSELRETVKKQYLNKALKNQDLPNGKIVLEDPGDQDE